MRRSTIFLGALLICASQLVHAGARDNLAQFTNGLKGLDGQFTQKVIDQNGKLKETSSGRVALSAPRLFRWEYKKPYEQLIVADGQKVWVYDPDLQQATVRPQGVEEQNSPLSILIDPGKLQRDYVTIETGQKNGLEWLEVEPKSQDDANFQKALLGFNKSGLVKMEITDSLGQRTEITFSSWKKNPAFTRTTFVFTPEKGVDVIGQ